MNQQFSPVEAVETVYKQILKSVDGNENRNEDGNEDGNKDGNTKNTKHDLVFGFGMHYNSVNPVIFAQNVYALDKYVRSLDKRANVRFYFKLPNYYFNSIGTVYSSLLSSYRVVFRMLDLGG